MARPLDLVRATPDRGRDRDAARTRRSIRQHRSLPARTGPRYRARPGAGPTLGRWSIPPRNKRGRSGPRTGSQRPASQPLRLCRLGAVPAGRTQCHRAHGAPLRDGDLVVDAGPSDLHARCRLRRLRSVGRRRLGRQRPFVVEPAGRRLAVGGGAGRRRVPTPRVIRRPRSSARMGVAGIRRQRLGECSGDHSDAHRRQQRTPTVERPIRNAASAGSSRLSRRRDASRLVGRHHPSRRFDGDGRSGPPGPRRSGVSGGQRGPVARIRPRAYRRRQRGDDSYGSRGRHSDRHRGS